MSPSHLPTIFLVTPSLNQGKFLRTTIESDLSQQYPGSSTSFRTRAPRTRVSRSSASTRAECHSCPRRTRARPRPSIGASPGRLGGGWDRALEEIFALVERRRGYVSLWWLVAKWDHRLDGTSQVTDPHPVPRRAYFQAL
jgi:hypothetical protein